jgi:hypothetical protein
VAPYDECVLLQTWLTLYSAADGEPWCHENHVLHVILVAKDSAALRQNITVQLDVDTIRKAKVLAAERGTSVSQLLASTIAAMVREEDRYQAARSRAMDLLKRGLHLGGSLRTRRDELHER